jgi:hypothetical protein
MDVSEAVDRLHAAQTAAGLGRIAAPSKGVEDTLAELSAAIAPLQLPADLVAFWRAVDPDTLIVAPCPRPVGPELSLRLWRDHLAGDTSLRRFLPWCHERADFTLVELVDLGGPGQPEGHGSGCYSWAGDSSPLVRTFCSVTAYVDLMATMLELPEARHDSPHDSGRHPALDPAHDGVPSGEPRATLTTVSAVRAAAADELRCVERAARRGDLRTAVRLATPLYDRLFRTSAAAQGRAIRPAG